MQNIQDLMIARPRLVWGEKINLGFILIFQVIAVVVLATAPLLAESWLNSSATYSSFQRWIYFYLPYFSGLIFLICSVWVFYQRRDDTVGQVFSLFASTAAIALFCLFDVYTSQKLTILFVFSIALCGAALINLGMLFPARGRISRQLSFARYLGYIPAAAFLLLQLVFLNYPALGSGFSTNGILAGIFIILALLSFFASALVARFESPSPNVQVQARLLIWSMVISFGPVLLWSALFLAQADFILSPFMLLTVNILPVSLAFAILRYRLVGPRFLLNRVVLYGALMVFAAGGYALFVSGLGILFGDLLQDHSTVLVGLVVFLIALLIYPLRAGFERRINAVLVKGKENDQENLQAFARELTKVIDLAGILNLLREYVERAVSPSQFYVYVLDPSKSYYQVATDAPGSEVRFNKNGALVQLLMKEAETILLDDENDLPVNLQVDQARLAVLGAKLFVPMLGQSGMVAWLALGEQSTGEPYSTQAIDYLDSLCDQGSLALERAQVVSALEQRIQEMDAITRVAQEINQKLAFGELLDMFYDQTRKLIPTIDFCIALNNDLGVGLQHVYHIANDEIIYTPDASGFTTENSLEAEVVQTGQAISTVDYAGECRRRGIQPDSDEILAWMGVPLNAGKEAIGAVSLGSRDPEMIYSKEQVNLLQAIADLAAGAIVKARLLAESQKQTHQLATLNELTRSLTSTLDLDPLLTKIVENAANILNCEAGSLLLVDEGTGELVFEVAIGPVGTNLKGQRLPPGVGLVGKAVASKKAIIQNDVRESDDWFNADEQTGFLTRDLMVVPLIVKDEVIGVLEILNKNDRLPFNSKDQDLLTAFAGQAAIAIENARLYTQTDQALAARVYELSVMQRIDRELNNSLEIDRVLSITLNWSLRHSKANAGLIGLFAEDGFRVVCSEGYSEDHLRSAASFFNTHSLKPDFTAKGDQESGSSPVGDPEVSQSVIRNKGWGELQADIDTQGFLLLPFAQNSLCISISRESESIGIIFLESASSYGFSDDTKAFLSRLSDHTAIAVSNAKLYTQVQKANISKSDFVSAAAHELKNPLTSIKGYSDLLVSGAAGTVNEAQSGFLTTIRSNAERMRILVSDLQDMSRIEAGQLQLKFSAVSLNDAVNEVVNAFESQISKKSQLFENRIPVDLPLLWCDETRLIQILINLVSNAHKYTPAGGKIELNAELAPNRWDEDGPRQVLLISVLDTGVGINQADEKKIFQQFFRSDDPQVREATGTGLGLSITKQLIEMQKGRIWFESEPGVGTVFHFTIPLAQDTFIE